MEIEDDEGDRAADGSADCGVIGAVPFGDVVECGVAVEVAIVSCDVELFARSVIEDFEIPE